MTKRPPAPDAVLVRARNLRKGDITMDEGEVLETPVAGSRPGTVRIRFSGNNAGIKPGHEDHAASSLFTVAVDGDVSNLPKTEDR